MNILIAYLVFNELVNSFENHITLIQKPMIPHQSPIQMTTRYMASQLQFQAYLC